MEFTVNCNDLSQQTSACIIVAVFTSGQLGPAAQSLDKASNGAILNLLSGPDIKGRTGETLMLHQLAGISSPRILLVGCGDDAPLSNADFRKIVSSATAALAASGISDALSTLCELTVDGRDLVEKASQHIEVSASKLYRFTLFKKEESPLQMQQLDLYGDIVDSAALAQGIEQGKAIAAGVTLCRDLGNMPANVCTPSHLANVARELASEFSALAVDVLEEKDMEELNMGALLSVARGSREDAKLITLNYQGGKQEDAPQVLVGKGVTFDSGGISIKPSAAMDEMKYDMCGAASVLGTIKAIATLQLPLNVVGIIPTTENMPDGKASKPGDVVVSMSGQSIEVLNTDAEGRLILCDALTYSARFKPARIIDIATLTGACVIALGGHATGLLANDDALANDLLSAGEATQDRAWRLPLWDEYQKQIDSNFADMGNVGGREAGTVTAACFLSRFTKEQRGAHLDIAGTAWLGGKEKGATGRPVPLLVQYLRECSQDC